MQDPKGHRTDGIVGREGPARLAVFDFDNTMIDGQTGVIFTRYLLDHDYITRWNTAKVIGWGAKYFVRLPVDQHRVREYIFDDLKGMTEDEFRAIAKDFHDRVLTECYRSDALETIAARQREGCVTIVASATFVEVVDEVAGHLRLDGAVGTHMELNERGRFTGHVKGEVVEGENKLRAIRAWADEHLGKGRWQLAYAYADHHSDYETLSCAVHPTTVHPSFSLLVSALREGWPVRNWR